MKRALISIPLLSWTLFGGSIAHAQDSGSAADPFFADKVTEEEARGDKLGTLVQGSLTSSTFFYQESGDVADEADFANEVSTVSPVQRLYTDLRAQFDAKHIGGGNFGVRADVRGRYSPACTFNSTTPNSPDQDSCRTQSGTYGGNEFDIRELYVRRITGGNDIFVGRQFVTELALTKVDGIRMNRQLNETWSVMGFAGLHPARTSRTILEDYPAQVVDGAGTEDAPIFPVAAGAGGSYRYASLYGSVGAVGIMPLNEQKRNGESGLESPRIYVTSNGYWRASSALNLYHYLVADGLGADGPQLTNLSLGANIRLTPALRLIASINRVDPETLNVIAQNRLEEASMANACQNNVDVSRIAFNEGRVALSSALSQQRFEVTVSGRVFQRDGFSLVCRPMNIELDPARGTEVMLSVVDRRSILGTRLGARVLGIIPFAGTNNQHRSTVYAAMLNGSRELASGRAELDLALGFVSSADENVEGCGMGGSLPCFGTSNVQTVSVDGTLFYRVISNLFAMASFSVASQALTTNAGQMNEASAPGSLLLSGFLRAAYRF